MRGFQTQELIGFPTYKFELLAYVRIRTLSLQSSFRNQNELGSNNRFCDNGWSPTSSQGRAGKVEARRAPLQKLH